jgi:hypothetical protein
MASNVPAIQADRPFNALNGNELKKAILNQIQRELDGDTRFLQALTYARCSWRWKLAIDLYPKDYGKKFESETGAGLLPPRPRQEEFSHEDAVRVDLSGHQIVAAPAAGVSADQVRRDAGLPVPVIRMVEGPAGERIMVEAPAVPVPGRGAVSEAPPEQRAAQNVSSGKGVFARSVTVRTAAAPDGVAVRPAGGHSPTAADAEEIVKRGLGDGTLEEKK